MSPKCGLSEALPRHVLAIKGMVRKAFVREMNIRGKTVGVLMKKKKGAVALPSYASACFSIRGRSRFGGL